ncbi:MAG: C-GCAxxG-C-C family protein [Thermodesulfobacteriota bacterium]
MEVFQDMIGMPRDRQLRAATGLEGGVVANGSTCGVVTGSLLGMALDHEAEVQQAGEAGRAAVMEKAQEFTRWFGEAYGSTLCRGRTNVSFYTPSGQLRYFLLPDKIARCCSHISGSFRRHFQERQSLPAISGDPPVARFHCAQAVLERVAARTGVEDPVTLRTSYILSGGAGLSGGACGALLGAVLAINLVLGLDIRNTPYLATFRPFVVGHLNLLRRGTTDCGEPFAAGRLVTRHFRRATGSLECAEILGRRFSSYEDFCRHTRGTDCDRIVGFAADAAVAVLDQNREKALP